MTLSPPVLDTVIVGSGIAGLTAAYELHRRGVGVQLLESRSRPGGVILTEQVGDFVIDAGPDSLLAQKPAAIDLCRELGLSDRLVSTLEPRAAYVLRDGILHALPEGAVLGIPIRVRSLISSSLFSRVAKMRIAAEVFVPRRLASEDDESIGAFVERRFGREAVTYLAEPLLAGIHAGDVNRLSMRALFPRLVDAEATHGSVIRALRQQPGRRSREGAFRSLAGGMGELVSALARHLPPGALRCNARVESVEGPGPFRVRLAGGDALVARSIVLATPAYVTAGLVRGLDAELATLCDAVPYASSATIVLAYRREAVGHALRGSGFVVPRTEGRSLLAASWISSKWAGRGPANMALMRGFVGGARDPAIIDREDHELISVTDDELRPLLKIGERPVFARVYRWPRANAQHETGHLARLDAIDRTLSRHPGVYVTGSGFRGVGIPDCVADGRTTAAAVADNLARIR